MILHRRSGFDPVEDWMRDYAMESIIEECAMDARFEDDGTLKRIEAK